MTLLDVTFRCSYGCRITIVITRIPCRDELRHAREIPLVRTTGDAMAVSRKEKAVSRKEKSGQGARTQSISEPAAGPGERQTQQVFL